MQEHLARSIRCVLAVAALAALAGCQTPTALTWKLPDGVQAAVVNGYPMAYSEAGTGPTVVLVHGVLCDYRCFTGQQRALSDTYRVVSVSLRHAYPQDWDGSGTTYSVAQHVKDLAALIEKMNPPVRLVGHSYGGQVAAELARQRPDLVARLVLAEGATAGVVGPESEQEVAGRQRTLEKLQAVYREQPYEDAVQYAVDMINGQGAWSRFPEPVRTIFKDNGWSIVAALRDQPRRLSCEEFGALGMPVLLVTGERTGPRFKEIVAAQGRCLPAARTVVIPNAGHAVQTNAQAFNAALREFLR